MAALLLSTADTDLLAAARSDAGWRVANPARTDPDAVPDLVRGVDLVVVRLLGGRRTWPEGLDAVLATGLPTVVLGGEANPDAELMAASTVPSGVATEALAYLVQGGAANLRELAAFLSVFPGLLVALSLYGPAASTTSARAGPARTEARWRRARAGGRPASACPRGAG